MIQTNNNEKNVVRAMDARIRDFKYKILIFISLILMYILYPFLSDSFARVEQLNADFEQLSQKHERLLIEKSDIDSDYSVVKYVETNKVDVIRCINENKCENLNLPGMRLDSRIGIIKSYLSLNKYEWEKMSYDQKAVLRNIVDYLLVDSQYSKPNWQMNIIAFWVPTIVSREMSLYRLPITMNIEFDNNNALFSFIKNIEKKIDTRYSLLQKITAVNYDIVNYQQKQVVNITIDTYFYK